MKTVIMAIGSRGDVAPFAGLGERLRAAGHDVAVATHAAFAEFVRERRLEFRLLPGDMRADLESAKAASGSATAPTRGRCSSWSGWVTRSGANSATA